MEYIGEYVIKEPLGKIGDHLGNNRQILEELGNIGTIGILRKIGDDKT